MRQEKRTPKMQEKMDGLLESGVLWGCVQQLAREDGRPSSKLVIVRLRAAPGQVWQRKRAPPRSLIKVPRSSSKKDFGPGQKTIYKIHFLAKFFCF